jgi:hypothetical protein
MNSKRNFCLVAILSAAIVLSSCASGARSTQPPSPGPSMTGLPLPYPIDPTSMAQLPYPVDSAISTPSRQAVPIRLNRPVVEGATEVTGTGPASLPILLQDVTFMGGKLADAVISPDGTFVFKVAPLEKNHRIGVAVGDLTGTSWRAEDFDNSLYWGPESMMVPQVNFYYDTSLVNPRP